MTLRRAHRLHTRTDSLYADWYIYADEAQVDVANNRSYVTVSMAIFCSPGYSFTSDGVSCGITGSADRSYGRTTWSGETTIATGSFWVNHDDNGEASAHIFYWGNTTWGDGCSGDFWLGLTTIARASQPSISPSTISAGSSCTIKTNRASGSFTHTIQYSFGSKSGTIATGVGASCSWTPSTDLLSQIPNSQSGSGTITCITYNGSTKIGTKTCSFTLNVPSDSSPSVGSISLTEQHSGVKAKNPNVTVQQISRKLVSVPVTAKYSTGIKSVVCDGVALTNNNGTYTGYVSNKSNGTYTVTATDNRGLQSTGTVKQTYYAYSKPYVTASLKRESETSQNGTLSASGTYSTILSNTVSMSIKRNDESSATSVMPTLSGGNISYSKSYTDLNYVQSFSIKVKVTDGFGESVETTATLGVGQYALWMGKYDVKVGGNLTVKGNIFTTKGNIFDIVYPVGSIYMSTSSVSPATLFGGMWEQINDRFLLAAGSTYAAGSTGGEATHKLTVNEMPSHQHTVEGHKTGSEAKGYGLTQSQNFVNRVFVDGGEHKTSLTGGNNAHNNMPPYLTVYMWKRIAIQGIQAEGVGRNWLRNSSKTLIDNSYSNFLTGTWRFAGNSSMKRSHVEISDPPKNCNEVTGAYQAIGKHPLTVQDTECIGMDNFPYLSDCKIGDVCTFSAWARVVGGGKNCYFGFSTYLSNSTDYSEHDKFLNNYAVKSLNTDGSWTRVVVHFKLTINLTGNLYVGFLTGDNEVTVQACAFKIEKSNEATDWTPAPEDE